MSVMDWANALLPPTERPPLAERLTEIYGPDLAAQVVSDIAAEVAELQLRAVGLEPDGVWEEGYGDALHDVLARLIGARE